MALEIPIIIGVADVKNRSTSISDAKEPAVLMHEAILGAISDAQSSDAAKLQASIDSIDVVKTWTWPYADLPGLLAEKLNVQPKHKFYSEHGGNQPVKLLDEAAKKIAKGEIKVAVITGGEALASLSACAAANKLPPPGWTTPAQAVDSVFTPTGHDLGENIGAVHDIGTPIQVYPLYENAFRAHLGQSIQENHLESAKLYAQFSEIASKQPYAWNSGTLTDEKTISTIGKKNRMICFPYPLLMNAFNTVNLSSALLLTSTQTATALSIPPSRWIYPLASAGTSEPPHFWHRPTLHTSPSISHSLTTALSLSSPPLTPSSIDIFDFYACFPIVPKLAAHHLGLSVVRSDKPLSVLGGLTSFGGAGNNYSMHAVAQVVRMLRAGRGRTALVLANGGVLTYQHVVVLSTVPREEGGYPLESGLPGEVGGEGWGPGMEVGGEGEGVVETYTVEFQRDGEPLRGYIVGRLKDGGKRFLANHGDENTLRQMAAGTKEIVGRTGWLVQDKERKGRGLFSFEKGAKM